MIQCDICGWSVPSVSLVHDVKKQWDESVRHLCSDCYATVDLEVLTPAEMKGSEARRDAFRNEARRRYPDFRKKRRDERAAEAQGRAGGGGGAP